MIVEGTSLESSRTAEHYTHLLFLGVVDTVMRWTPGFLVLWWYRLRFFWVTFALNFVYKIDVVLLVLSILKELPFEVFQASVSHETSISRFLVFPIPLSILSSLDPPEKLFVFFEVFQVRLENS